MEIKNKQIEQMVQVRRQQSQQLLMEELRQTSPTATSHYDNTSLLSVIEQATLKAKTYGITSSESVTIFIKLAVFAGINFDDDPKVKRFLQAPELSSDFKMTLLAELVAEKVKQSI